MRSLKQRNLKLRLGVAFVCAALLAACGGPEGVAPPENPESFSQMDVLVYSPATVGGSGLAELKGPLKNHAGKAVKLESPEQLPVLSGLAEVGGVTYSSGYPGDDSGTTTLYRLGEGAVETVRTLELGFAPTAMTSVGSELIFLGVGGRDVARYDTDTGAIGFETQPFPPEDTRRGAAVVGVGSELYLLTENGDLLILRGRDWRDVGQVRLEESTRVPLVALTSADGRIIGSTVDGQFYIFDPRVPSMTLEKLGNAPNLSSVTGIRAHPR